MIPLGRWLQKEDGPAYREPGPDPLPAPQPAAECEIPPDEAAQTARGDIESLEERIRGLLQQLEEQRDAAALREQQLTKEFGGTVATQIASEVRNGLGRLQSAIEEAVFDALLPFLGDMASRKATDELLVLLRQAMKEVKEPVLQISSPRHIHAHLDALRGEQPGVSFMESDKVELNFASGASRFEILAQQWIDMLHGPAP